MAVIFKCKMCGGTLQADLEKKIAVCDSCGTEQTIPSLDDEKKANMFDRANHFRVNNEYDKALSMYEKLLELDGNDAEIYWSMVLCKYGIEYVEDPSTHKRIPTINRLQYDSILSDSDYKMALEKANSYQKRVYENEAQIINNIQKDILAISQQEEPFDVFICYKETDNNGRRTKDSVLANDLYHQLSNEGFKVFFARITLEDKLGEQYEPFIFAALNSAKVMVVLGTNKDYFNAVWVKNEWSRFLTLAKKDSHKTLIPAYKDMDPYDLPDEFSHLQAQDMSKLGFMSDLIRGIKKLVNYGADKVSASPAINQGNMIVGNIVALIKRMNMAVEDGEFDKVEELAEKILDIDAENGNAYLARFLASYKVKNIDEISCVFMNETLDDNLDYKRATKFLSGDIKGKLEKLPETRIAYFSQQIKENIEKDNFKQVPKLCEQILKLDDKNGNAYLARFLANYKVKSIGEINSIFMCDALNDNFDYKMATKFLSGEIKSKLEKLPETRITYFSQRVKEKLEEGNFEEVLNLCEQILKLDTENGNAYLARFLAGYRVKNIDGISCIFMPEALDDNFDYEMAMKFLCDEDKSKLEKLSEARISYFYQQAKEKIEEKDFEQVLKLCGQILILDDKNGNANYLCFLAERGKVNIKTFLQGMRVNNIEDFTDIDERTGFFGKALEYGDDGVKNELGMVLKKLEKLKMNRERYKDIKRFLIFASVIGFLLSVYYFEIVRFWLFVLVVIVLSLGCIYGLFKLL